MRILVTRVLELLARAYSGYASAGAVSACVFQLRESGSRWRVRIPITRVLVLIHTIDGRIWDTYLTI